MDKKLTSRKSKEDFAKAMNCSVKLVDRIEKLTNDIASLNILNTNHNFEGNDDCGYCGRYFEESNALKKGEIWIGGIFERWTGDVKLFIAFFDLSEKKYGEKLKAAHYQVISKYSKIDKGYWLYIKVDSLLQSCCDIDDAKNQIKEILDDVDVLNK